MSLSNVDLNLLVPLHALLHERSVSRAAARTGVSQPAMSHSLKRLRSLLEDDLLVRSREGRAPYRLTARATSLLDPLDRLLASAAEEIFDVDSFDPATSSRVMTIAASSSTALVALQPLIAEVGDTAPGVSLRIVRPTTDIDAVFERSDVDLALIPDVLPTTHPRERLYGEEWVFVTAVENRDVGDALTLEQIVDLPHAVFEEYGLRTHGELLLESLGTVRRTVVCDDFLTLLHMITGTSMIGLIQRRVATALGPRAGVRTVASPVVLPRFGIDLVRNSRGDSDGALTWLRRRLWQTSARLRD